MADNLRDQLIQRFSEVLTAHTQALPTAIPYAVPVRKLAEAAIDVLTMGRGVPMIPAYDAELAAQRSWCGVRSAEDLENGLGFTHVEVMVRGELVQLTTTNLDAQDCGVDLPPNDAEEFALHVLAATDEARRVAHLNAI